MVGSRSNKQLKGENLSESVLKKSCDGALTNTNMAKTTSIDGTGLTGEDVAIPCGLMAKSFPDGMTKILKNLDKFKTLTDSSSNVIEISTSGIADTWYKDLFKNIDIKLQWQDMEDERFINWMKSGSLSTFPK